MRGSVLESYRVCVRVGGVYTERPLGFGFPTETAVKVAGGFVAIAYGGPRNGSVLLFDPAWGGESIGSTGTGCEEGSTVIGCDGNPSMLRGFAVDRLGRVAWIESYTSGGKPWVRLRVRTQAGSMTTVARRRGLHSIAGMRLASDGLRWSAKGQVHRANVERPRCQIALDPERVLDPGVPRLLATNRDVIVAGRGGDAISGCLRSDGRWRELLRTNTASSHGDALTNVLTAGTWVALNDATYPEDVGSFTVTDLRSGRSDHRDAGWPLGSVDALAPDGRYVFHSSPYPPDSTQLFAARVGKPDAVQIDSGGAAFRAGEPYVRVFTDVQITRGRASWKNAGVAKSALLP